jgi:cytochrome d ubiquinol oxidase subunit II
MLVGIVLRGSAFTFRTYDNEQESAQRRWGRIFASASVITPILLGVCIGAVAAGTVRPLSSASFVDQFINSWLTPFAISVGILTLVLFAFLAAVFLTMETHDPELREDFRKRALAAGIAVFFASGLALLLSQRTAPLVHAGLMASVWALPLHLATGAAAILVLLALWFRWFRLARIAVGLQVSLIFWGWALAQYPLLVPPDLTITNSAAPHSTLRLTLLTLIGGGVLLLPSLWYLFQIFKSVPADPSARPRIRSS